MASFLKVRLDALDKIAKLLGGYPAENRVNVQVNVINDKQVFEEKLKVADEYFNTLDAEVIDATADP